ncbi:uncharacterized protein TOL2_C12630 [Desulfobacula toluolica Tol2]|uniref:Core-binding (CB) domain-containing protein n=1 Tax=Desulfobacula toluolica (strain DSM 7467 / Tol2) TaxID=651182 RepID=K0NEF4_DESTT|nr:uncharacterized protein TOL2_C12630 [Desulfobacula toluolica Tol2]
MRVQTDKGQFDQREWAKDQPLSFYALRKKFLAHKKKDGIGKKQIQHITHVLNVAGKAWDQMQIKEIAEPEIEDFFDDLKASGKTKKNYQTVLHNFWAWVVRREKWILFPDTKEGIPKFIHLLPEHADLIREIRGPKGMPDMYFFRHVKAKPSVKAGTRFGQKQFRMWWNRACKNLNIEGVDLYGGTKHSTVTALGQVLTPEQIQRGVTGHISDAFKRYMLPDKNDAIQGEPKQFNRCNLKMITS